MALVTDETERKRFKAAMDSISKQVQEQQVEIQDAKDRLKDLRDAKEETQRAKEVAK